METVLAALVGLFFAAAIYLLLSRALIRMLLGIVLLGNAVNLLIFVAGRLTRAVPPIIPAGAKMLARRLRQSAAAGADPDRHRHRLCHVRLPAGARLPRLSGAGRRRYRHTCAWPNRTSSRNRRWSTER